MEYTKGEWKFRREEYIVSGVFSSIEAGDIKICYLKEPHYMPDCGDRTWYNGSVERMKANAQLISAAPDLYEACKEALIIIARQAIRDNEDEYTPTETKLMKAIAKADS